MMQGIGVVWLGGQNGRIESFRFGKPPLPVQFESLHQCVSHIQWHGIPLKR